MAEEKYPRFSENDEVTRARALWKENGKSIIFGISLGLAGIVGFNSWGSHEQTQGEQAASLYQQVLSGTGATDAPSETLKAPSETLKMEFGNTVYAALGAFSQAKGFVEDKDYDAAIDQLEWVLGNSGDERIRHIARQRLALVYIADDNPQSAIELLTINDMGNFEARYQEILGDAFMKRNQQGDSDLARRAYQSSLDKTRNNETDKTLLQLKMRNTGES